MEDSKGLEPELLVIVPQIFISLPWLTSLASGPRFHYLKGGGLSTVLLALMSCRGRVGTQTILCPVESVQGYLLPGLQIASLF